jgi:hypothetical protein
MTDHHKDPEADNEEERSSFSLSPVQDKQLWVLDKLTTAVYSLNDREGSVQYRMQRGLYDLIAIHPDDLPQDLRDTFQVIRNAMGKISLTMTDREAEEVISTIVFLRNQMDKRLQPE